MVNSKFEQLSNEEIIKIASENTGSKYSPDQVYAAMLAESRQQDTLVLKQGNTLFIVHRSEKDPSVAVFRALNADIANNYVKNSEIFIRTMKSMGFQSLVTIFNDPSILNIIKYNAQTLGVPSGTGYKVQRTKDGGYYVTINLGSKTSGLETVKG